MINLLPWIAGSLATTEGGEGGHHALGFGIFAYLGLTLLVIGVFIWSARKGITSRVPTQPTTQWAEHIYAFIENLAVSTIGPHGRKYVTYLATIWLIIFVSNIVGLFMSIAATANLALNAGLAIASMMYVQWSGIKAHGFRGYLQHFAGPKLGGILTLLSILLFVVEAISESAKMISLPFRLFMNIEGGHIVIKGFNTIINVNGAPFPLGYFLLPIELLTSVIQAFIFTLLVGVYIGLLSGHEESEEHESVPVPQKVGTQAVPR